MSETMLVGGSGDESHKVGGALLMAPGLGLMTNVIIDSEHFAERGRIGRLLGAVAQNPRILGVGHRRRHRDHRRRRPLPRVRFRRGLRHRRHQRLSTRMSRKITLTGAMSIFDVRLHILSAGDVFDCGDAAAGQR